MEYKHKKGFSLSEVLIVMTIIGIVACAMAPVYTINKASTSGSEKNAQSCILNDSGSLSASSCISAINNCKMDKLNSCNVLIKYVNTGTTDQSNQALGVLKETCNQGGEKACDVFTDRCLSNTSLCDVADDTNDLQSYFDLSMYDTTAGRLYLANKVKLYYDEQITEAITFIDDSCDNKLSAQACFIKYGPSAGGNDGCASGSDPNACQQIVDDCDGGNTAACQQGYSLDLNTSCLNIKTKTNTTISKAYKLTYNSNGDNYDAYCDMTNDGGGWTLVLKVDGNNNTFIYADSIWKNSVPYNETSADLTKNEHKNPAFSYIPFSQIKLVFNTPTSSTEDRNLILYVTSTDMMTLMNSGYTSTSAGMSAWRNLISTTSSMQDYLYKEGINSVDIISDTKIRIGVLATMNSFDPDSYSFIGVGGRETFATSLTLTGNFCAYFSCDNGDVQIASFAYVYIK